LENIRCPTVKLFSVSLTNSSVGSWDNEIPCLFSSKNSLESRTISFQYGSYWCNRSRLPISLEYCSVENKRGSELDTEVFLDLAMTISL
jgi:hypothetical protein